jgi:ribosomal protein L16 Arg81 hydroxylase
MRRVKAEGMADAADVHVSHRRRKKLDLDALLAPVSSEKFFSDYWERAPLYVGRADETLYESLVAADDLERLVAAALCASADSVELLGDTAGGAVTAAADAAALGAAYGRGASFRVMGLERFWPQARDLTRRLEQRLGCPVAANLYATPAGAQGAPRHYDNHDVLVLQLRGRKRWRIHAPVVRLPLGYVPPLAFEGRDAELKYARGGPKKGRAQVSDEEAGEPAHEWTLAAGDLLYLPRGYVHEARTQGEASFHLTLGLHVVTWLDLLTVAAGQWAQRDVRLRRTLPVGLLDDTHLADAARAEFDALASDFAREARLRDALTEVAEALVKSRRAAAGGAQDTDGASGDLCADTLLARRPGVLLRLAAEGDTVGLLSAEGALWMPKMFTAALRFVARSQEFRVGEIPGDLSERGRLALARWLVRDGFVRVARGE